MLFVLYWFVDFELEFVGKLEKLRMKLGEFGREIAPCLGGEIGAMGQFGASKKLGEPFVPDALVDFFDEAQVFIEEAHESRELGALDAAGAFAVANDHAFGGALDCNDVEFALVLDVLLGAALLNLEEWRLSDVNVAALDELGHVSEEERQQQGANVRAVDVGVGHEDDFAVANLGGIEVVFADAAT